MGEKEGGVVVVVVWGGRGGALRIHLGIPHAEPRGDFAIPSNIPPALRSATLPNLVQLLAFPTAVLKTQVSTDHPTTMKEQTTEQTLCEAGS